LTLLEIRINETYGKSFDLSNKLAVITGASSGIGLQTALEFCRHGASVIGVARQSAALRRARLKDLSACPGAKILYLIADLSLQSEIRRLAGDIEKALRQQVHPDWIFLVNNAGLFMDSLVLTEDGIETTIAVNHWLHFCSPCFFYSAFRPSEQPVITVSSGSHYRTG